MAEPLSGHLRALQTIWARQGLVQYHLLQNPHRLPVPKGTRSHTVSSQRQTSQCAETVQEPRVEATGLRQDELAVGGGSDSWHVIGVEWVKVQTWALNPGQWALSPAQCFCFSPLASTLDFSDMVFKGYSRKLIAILKFYVAEEATPIFMWASELSLLPGPRRKGQQQNWETTPRDTGSACWRGAGELAFLVVSTARWLLEEENQRQRETAGAVPGMEHTRLGLLSNALLVSGQPGPLKRYKLGRWDQFRAAQAWLQVRWNTVINGITLSLGIAGDRSYFPSITLHSMGSIPRNSVSGPSGRPLFPFDSGLSRGDGPLTFE